MRKVLKKIEKPNCRNLKITENFSENRKDELWKLESCGKLYRKSQNRIVKTLKLRRILQKTEKTNCRNLKVAESFIENCKTELWKLKSCVEFFRKPKSRIMTNLKLRKILQKTENFN